MHTGGPFGIWPVRLYGADKILSGVGFDETLSGDPVLAEAIRLAQPSLDGLLINLRLVVERAEVERRPGVYDFAALDARMTLYRGLGSVRVYIDLRDALPALDELDGWGRFVRAVRSVIAALPAAMCSAFVRPLLSPRRGNIPSFSRRPPSISARVTMARRPSWPG